MRLRHFVRRGAARAFIRRPKAELAIPVAAEPDPAFLIDFPDETTLPAELQDRQLLLAALARRKRAAATPHAETPTVHRPTGRPRSTGAGRPLTNILFVSHCDFTGNSALHVYSIATELHRRGFSPVIAVPRNAKTVEDIGRPPFPVVTYREARRGKLRFPDGRGPDLVHAFTPRELVRELTFEVVKRYACSYVVHLEDNEDAILSAELGGATVDHLRELPLPLLDTIIGPHQSHPLRAPQFLEHAAGVTVVIARLMEMEPDDVPGVVVRAGFDESVLSPRRPREEVRHELDLSPDDIVIAYTGNIHPTNLEDMRSLYLALESLRRDGRPVVLVKTGWGSGAASLPALGDGLRDLGWVPRAFVPELLAAADVLVQPGGPDPFNDYRFPSKLPEFLASGRPVVLPRTNIGLELENGREALVLERGDAEEIAAAVARLSDDAELRASIGKQGRAFALRELRWARSVDNVEELYREISHSARPPDTAVLAGPDPPVRLVALAPALPDPVAAEAARAHGICGFCVPVSQELPGDFAQPFCFHVSEDDGDAAGDVLAMLSSPHYLRVGGAALLLADDAVTAARWRASAEHAGVRVHLSLLQRSEADIPGAQGFDSAVEARPIPAEADTYDELVQRRLAGPLPDYEWFRTVAPPGNAGSWTSYRTWLRKLVLQALLCAPVHEPLIFVDAPDLSRSGIIREPLLSATRGGIHDGARQFYASRRLQLTSVQVDEALRIR